MSATASPIATPLLTDAMRPARILIGLHEERPCPGAVAYQAIAALTTTSIYRNPRLDQGTNHVRTKQSVALALTEATRQEDADAGHLRLLESVAPLLGMGPTGLPLAVDLLRQGSIRDGHQVLVWSDGHHAQLLFQGEHRIIYIQADHASLIRPRMPDGIGHCGMPLHHGDIIVMVAHATQAQLPLGTVAKLARVAESMQALCQQATQLAATGDPLSHHAALALTVLPSNGQ